MEFNEKLRMLRKQKGLTQEELAGALYVSRTAVSKWESGRGYPNIDSLKAISDFFSVTLDELISAGELASADEPSPSPEPEREPPDSRPRSLLFALSDISAAAFLFLPLFAHRPDGAVRAVSLLFLTGIAPYMKAAYLLLGICMMGAGLVSLLLRFRRPAFPARSGERISLLLNGLALLLFILGRQPYAAAFALIYLAVKAFPLLKER